MAAVYKMKCYTVIYHKVECTLKLKTRMWANAQCNGHPAEYICNCRYMPQFRRYSLTKFSDGAKGVAHFRPAF